MDPLTLITLRGTCKTSELNNATYSATYSILIFLVTLMGRLEKNLMF
jgi:hypothetical protein